MNVMLLLLGALALASSASAAGLSSFQGASPVAKVTALLQNLEAKVSQEQRDAKGVYLEYAEWCKDRGVALNHSISLEGTDIEHLRAMIEANKARIDEFNGAMEEASAKRSKYEELLKKAEFDYKVEKGTLEQKEKELTEMIQALDRTIHILKKEALKKKNEGSVVLAEIAKAKTLGETFKLMIDADMIQAQDQDRLAALIQTSDQDQVSDFGADLNVDQDAKVLENSAVDMLGDLESKAKKDRDQIRFQLLGAKQTFEQKVAAIHNEMALEQREFDKAKRGQSVADEQKGEEEGSLATTESTLNADEAAYLQTQNDCYKAQIDYTEKARSRKQEIEALQKAMEAMQKTTGADKVVQSRKSGPESFLQTSSKSGNVEYQAVKYVRSLAHSQKSKALSNLAGRMASAIRFGSRNGEDPFEKVAGLLRNMLEKLEEEAEKEATQKAYCDKELKSTKEKTEDKTEANEELTTEIDQLTARSVEAHSAAADMQKDLTELIKNQNEMDRVRQEEAELFRKSKKEMDDGLDGVKIASRILREYYQDVDTQINDKHGMDSQGGYAIIGFLEVIESDFSKTVAEIVATEMVAKENYKKTQGENVILKKQKEIDLRWKQGEAKDFDSQIAELKGNLDSVLSELNALSEYKAHLDEQCIAKVDSYEERRARQEAEVAGLKNALDILNGQGEILSLNSRRGVNAKETGIYSDRSQADNFLQRGRRVTHHHA